MVNCIILGLAEAYASKHGVIASIFDGIGMGLGFTLALTCIGMVRELIGAGKIFGIQIMPSFYHPITIFILAPGAFFVLAFLIALQNKFKIGSARVGEDGHPACSRTSCMNCGNRICSGRMAAQAENKEGEA